MRWGVMSDLVMSHRARDSAASEQRMSSTAGGQREEVGSVLGYLPFDASHGYTLSIPVVDLG